MLRRQGRPALQCSAGLQCRSYLVLSHWPSFHSVSVHWSGCRYSFKNKSKNLFPKTMKISTISPFISNISNNMLVYYQELWDLRDKRVDNWPMINSPWPTISLCVGYIYMAMVLGKLNLYLMFKVELVFKVNFVCFLINSLE